MKLFDLNIEEVLEDWESEHAIREIIANALDEQLLTNTKDIEIKKDSSSRWHIRDFGRGLQIEHFTLNENPEKINNNKGVIGKFGVGLKDALATFYRRRVGVEIKSKYGTFHLKKETKQGFENISTLHVEYDETQNNIVGTEFLLSNVSENSIKIAKSFFIKFNKEIWIDDTEYGQIFLRTNLGGKVYVNGVFAADEPNFMFTYNITNLTESIKKKLNRERINVGRTTYSGRVKDIILASQNNIVQENLVEQCKNRSKGILYDELSWIEVSQKALNLLHQSTKAVFLTDIEIQEHPELLDWARRDGFDIVPISQIQKEKLDRQMSEGGPEIRTAGIFINEVNDSFRYRFINLSELNDEERYIFKRAEDILNLINLSRWDFPKLLISETMRITNDDTGGIWDSNLGAIVIKRSQLSSIENFSATLLHETGHEQSGATDCTRSFESTLTNYLGRVSKKAINNV
ncbi:MAG: hypothetical protein Q8N39_06135 [Pelolinea sp.]|nr:hypothetical protein [Pelolinea sp.]